MERNKLASLRIRDGFEKRYDEHNLKMALNISTFLGPRFKSSCVFIEKKPVELSREQEQPQDTEERRGGAAAGKRKRSDLCSITSEKNEADCFNKAQDPSLPTTPRDTLNVEITDWMVEAT
ncbi:unnamed protein product [Pleuronectes platessa]|uniref:Uncharacterized protein n=1 Tax=Pleuronectes platessa TaxID=8262 RepID=A0A9N7UB73_PLEPL|nr:unnamed protein product [Pleuronectes platessa]